MVFSHDTTSALQAAVALANTLVPPDTLQAVENLDELYERYEYTGRRDRDAAELAAVRDLRPRLYELLTAGKDRAAGLVNDLLAEHGALPQLVRHGTWDWHLHAVAPGAPLATRIAVETAMAMADVVRSQELSRLAVCADATCRGVVLDLSRNRSRRFCSTACGNRNAVAAYRSRRRGAG